MRLPAVRTHDEAQRALAAARELTFGRLTVYEIPAGRGEIVRRARAVGSLLLPNHKKEVDAVFALAYELVGRRHHRRRDSLRIARAAAVQPVAAQSGWMIRRHRIEVRGERDPAAPARRPDVATPWRHFLDRHVPVATHEPARDEIDRRALVSRERLYRQQFCSERDDIGHARKLVAELSRWERRATGGARARVKLLTGTEACLNNGQARGPAHTGSSSG